MSLGDSTDERSRNDEKLSLLTRAGRLVTRTCRRKSLAFERRIGGLPVVDSLCLRYSIDRLERRMAVERSLEDILDTVGTSEDLLSMYHTMSLSRPAWSLGLTSAGKYCGLGKYRTMKASQFRDEIRGLAETVERHEPETVVEVGTARGGSLYVWARYLDSVDRILSIDIDHNGMEPFFRRFATDTEITCLTGSSHSSTMRDRVERELQGREIDFLYIDGDHSYEGVKADFETYRPFMSSDGLVGFNDVEDTHPGVLRFWNELAEDYETELFGEDGGVSGIVYL